MGSSARRTRRSMVVCGLVAAVVAVGAACMPIDRVDFANFTYASDACDPIISSPPATGYDVVDGAVRHGDPAAADFYSVSVRSEVTIGDLTGDGVDEAAIILDCSTGSRPIPVGRVMTTHGAETAALATVPAPALPDGARRAELAHLQIDTGALIATWVVLRAEDPSCCPTGRLTTVHRWQGDRFDTSVA